MASYKKHVATTKSVTKKIYGKDMVKNHAGGYSFKSDDFEVLKRWLLTGSTSNSFYQSAEEKTDDNVENFRRCLSNNVDKTVDEILYATDNAINNHTSILAMVYLSMGNFYCKKKFKENFFKVIRTASHLYEFFSYCKEMRGMGKSIHNVVTKWLTKDLSEKDLEYQLLKYQQRGGWSARDVLRLIKPVPKTEKMSALFSWSVGKNNLTPEQLKEKGLTRVGTYEELKSLQEYDTKEIASIIRSNNLTHEMIPANIKRDNEILQALFERMPITASLRNLASYTEKGIFNDDKNIELLQERFSFENIKRGRVHPLTMCSAYKIYNAGGSLGKTSLRWIPNKKILMVLEGAIENSFKALETTGKHFYHALDISGSMEWHANETLWLTSAEIAGIMALATVKSEPNFFAGAFSEKFSPLRNFTKDKKFDYAISGKYREGKHMGGTNAGSAVKYAIENGIKTDVFIFWTDNENWMGDHVSLLLEEYRNKINKDANAIFVSIEANGITSVDPKDKLSYDICGFNTNTVKLIQYITEGKF